MNKRFGLEIAVMVLLAMLVFSVSAEAGWRHFGWRFGGARARCNNSYASTVTSTNTGTNSNAGQGDQHQVNYEPAYQPQQAPEPPQMNEQRVYNRDSSDRDNSNRSDSDKNQTGAKSEGSKSPDQDKASGGG